MRAQKEVYLLDAGNTQIKLALAQEGVIQQIERFSYPDFHISTLDRNIPLAFSSVVEVSLKNTLRTYFNHTFEITSLIALPFQMAYQSPQTLGMDRLCNAAALSAVHQGKARLAIDLGTCIKFDFLDAQNNYLGGSISPGLQMRAKAMAHFTAKLPEVEGKHTAQLIGTNSQESLEIGTFLGWQKEIEGLLDAYLANYPELVVLLTGGDAKHFDLGQKNGIFVHENLTLEGILALYYANE
jgi:type III pantothenate kinase